MPRPRKLKYSRVIPSRWAKDKTTSEPSTPSSSRASTPSSSSSWSSASSSERKLTHLDEYDKFDDSSILDIVDITSYSKFICEEFDVRCKECEGEVSSNIIKRVGLAVTASWKCKDCGRQRDFVNSPQVERNVMDGKKVKMSAVNLRIVYAFRGIGKGQTAANLFCALMNLPHPPRNYAKYELTLADAAKVVAERSMERAAAEASEMEETKDVAVGVDGTWQKRGHVSLNCIVAATSVETGKVVDVEALSKYCRCKDKSNHGENCTANFQGSSGAMEAEGAVRIFSRSERRYGLRYTKFLGDGDSKAFKAVQEKKIYGECEVTKLECVGHIQKRMGSRLKTLKMKKGKEKLSDNKPLGGKGRLTDAAILKIQNYYGQAIRNNVGDLESMKKAAWALFFHVASSDVHPVHWLCPPGKESWCRYRKAEAEKSKYSHKQHFHLDMAVMTEIKPIFRNLANPELLKKCLHGGTQNPNESFNNVVWNRVPKNVFVSLNVLLLGMYDAVCNFNDGNISRCWLFQELKIPVGAITAEILKGYDLKRIQKSNRELKEWAVRARHKRSLVRKKLEDKFSEEEAGPSYAAGAF